jgi:uncharacterized membrane protein YoaK (UPF0700 family)
MSFTQFFLKSNPLRIICTKCGVNLKAGKMLNCLFISAVIYGFVLGVVTPYLYFKYSWEILHTILFFILAVAVVGIPAEYSAWKYGHYKVS